MAQRVPLPPLHQTFIWVLEIGILVFVLMQQVTYLLSRLPRTLCVMENKMTLKIK